MASLLLDPDEDLPNSGAALGALYNSVNDEILRQQRANAPPGLVDYSGWDRPGAPPQNALPPDPTTQKAGGFMREGFPAALSSVFPMLPMAGDLASKFFGWSQAPRTGTVTPEQTLDLLGLVDPVTRPNAGELLAFSGSRRAAREAEVSARTANTSLLGDVLARTEGSTSPGILGDSPLLRGITAAPGDEYRVSTRIPTSVDTDRAAAHAANDLQVDSNSIFGTSAEPKVVARLQGYDDLPTAPGMDSQATVRAAVDHMKGNLRWIYENMHPEVREQAAQWYDGANKLTGELASQYDVPHEAVAALTARLSPGTDWYQNVSMAKRILAIDAEQQGTALSDAQRRLIQGYIDSRSEVTPGKAAAKANLQAEFDGIGDKTYADLTDMQRAMFVRSHDEARSALDPTNAYFNKIHPFGHELGLATQADNVTPTELGWQSLDNISSGMSILRDPSRPNISIQLGNAHKIRSFNNNIIAPNSGAGDVTVDTHQIAASHLLPIGIKDPTVTVGMSGPPYANQTGSTGLYGVYADAVRELTGDLNQENEGLNLLPRQLQSITWEGARGLYPAGFKRGKTEGLPQADFYRNIWNTQPNAAAAREAIGLRRGVTNQGDESRRIPPPDWFTPNP